MLWAVGGGLVMHRRSTLAVRCVNNSTPTLPQGRERCFAATEPWILGAAWTPGSCPGQARLARVKLARLAGDADYLCFFVTEAVFPGE